jgi:hypothetical protein
MRPGQRHQAGSRQPGQWRKMQEISALQVDPIDRTTVTVFSILRSPLAWCLLEKTMVDTAKSANDAESRPFG